MSAPALWIAVPLLVGALSLMALSERSAAIAGGLTCILLAIAALTIPIDEALLVGPFSLKIGSTATLFGRNLIIGGADGPLLAFIFGVASMWFYGAEAVGVARRLVPMGMLIVGLLIASLAVQPFLYAAMLIEMAALAAIPLLVPQGKTPLYVFVACAVPVWLILQPRDFTNVQILYGGIALVAFSALVAGAVHGVTLQAPALDMATGEAALKGGIWPLLFIRVACGAISGFHSLVASGTTVRQVARESNCRTIGYGAMILESLLAVVVLVAVASMLPQAEYLDIVYPPDRPSNPMLGYALGTGRLINLALPFVPVAAAVVFGILTSARP